MDNILWDLFKATGDIKYFLLLQKLEVRKSGDKKIRGDHLK